MKKLFIPLAVLMAGCFGHVDQNKAKALVVTLIQKIDSGKYDETSKFYTDEFNAGESAEIRAEKYKALKEAFGNVESMECVSMKDSTDPDDRPIVQLVYKVKHTKLTSLEAYTVVSQAGSYRIEQQDIKQQQ